MKILSSSGAVYGFNKNSKDDFKEDIDIHKIHENDFHAYRDAKRIAENLVSNSIAKEKYIIAKASFSVNTFHLKAIFAFSNFISSALNEEDIIIKGDGKTIDLIYIVQI